MDLVLKKQKNKRGNSRNRTGGGRVTTRGNIRNHTWMFQQKRRILELRRYQNQKLWVLFKRYHKHAALVWKRKSSIIIIIIIRNSGHTRSIKGSSGEVRGSRALLIWTVSGQNRDTLCCLCASWAHTLTAPTHLFSVLPCQEQITALTEFCYCCLQRQMRWLVREKSFDLFPGGAASSSPMFDSPVNVC